MQNVKIVASAVCVKFKSCGKIWAFEHLLFCQIALSAAILRSFSKNVLVKEEVIVKVVKRVRKKNSEYHAE